MTIIHDSKSVLTRVFGEPFVHFPSVRRHHLFDLIKSCFRMRTHFLKETGNNKALPRKYLLPDRTISS